ncbi:unnamed protein product [Closterium sp. NIES-64]|nr:unnamed protein product [Closterium sp. NIES-64]
MAVPQRLQDLCALLYRAITRAAVGNLPVRALLLLALAVVVSLVVWAAPWPAATLDMLASPSGSKSRIAPLAHPFAHPPSNPPPPPYLPFPIPCCSPPSSSRWHECPSRRCSPCAHGGSPTSAELYEAWAHLFALDSPVPPPAIAMPASLPPAPHLEDCAVRTALRLASEHTGARQTAAGNGEEEERGEGEAPEWARASAACGNVPQPPWVRRWQTFPSVCSAGRDATRTGAHWGGFRWHIGSGMGRVLVWNAVRGADAANLGSTREVQRDLWAHQFPPGSWALSVAVSSQRVLVPMPGSFLPANHPHCHAVNESGSLHCYFVRSVSPACEAAAMQQYRLAASPPCRPLAQLTSALASNDSLVCALATLHPSSRPDSAAARAWGNAYKQRPYLVEERGVMVNATEEHMQAYWWQAQALRFLLRWPSALLCHATNRMRHSAYGLQAAEHSAEYMKEQREIVTALRSDPPDPNPGVHLRAEAAILTTRDYTKHPNLETEVWPGLGYAGCGYASETGSAGEDRGGREAEKVGGTGGGGWTIGSWTIGGWSIASWGIGAADEEDVVEEKPAPLLMYERVGREVVMPRPVVSMHVEHQAPGHAGASADVLLPLLSLAYRLRQHDPSLQFAWLSADDLNMSQQLSTLTRPHLQSSWSFLHPYGTDLQEHNPVAAMFSNLLISSDATDFAGCLVFCLRQMCTTSCQHT